MTRIAAAHDHQDGDMNVADGQTVTADPLDAILWIHIFLQMFVYGVLFPLGMVLGIVKSRFHVPCQVTATILAILGALLGHSHKGRQFVSNNAHSKFANPLQFLLATQVALGLYLRMHLERGINGRIRPAARIVHSFLGKAFPILSWTQMLFGGITALGFCQGDHVGQCAAHFIMGSAFVAYGSILIILLVVGQEWLSQTGRSQEFFDSAVIASWGCINTFTEHHWGTKWVKNDWQHTSMGIIWWCAGLAGVWLSRDRHGNPQRNFVPGMVLVITGWAFGAHPQEFVISAKVHQMFGYALMIAGLARVIEVAFVLRDKPTGVDGKVWSWQYVPIYMLFVSGFLFMGATEEQMHLVALINMDHVSYILIMYSTAFLVFLFVNMLVSVYNRAMNASTMARNDTGYTEVPGRRRMNDDANRLRDTEEFELDGLMSDDEEAGFVAKAENRIVSTDEGVGSPSSTVGKNDESHV